MGIFLRIVTACAAICAAAPAQSLYRIQAFAGSLFSGDGGLALRAPLVQPQGLATDRDGSILVADAGDHRVRRILVDGTIASIAVDASPRMRNPYGVAVGPHREIYIADLGNGRVLRVLPNGSIRAITGFEQPRNVAVDANGILYVSDFAADRVYKVGPEDKLQVVAGNGDESLKGPAGLAFDASGTLYIADSGHHRVLAVAGGKTRTVLDNFGAVTSIAVDKTGRLYAAGGDRVAAVAPSGDVSIVKTAADDVAVDLTGALLVSTSRQVRLYRGGTTTLIAGSGSGTFAGDGATEDQWRFHGPSAAVRDQGGNLYIADSGNGRVRRIDPENRLSTVASGLGFPASLALDSSELLYFADAKAGTVSRLDRDGSPRVFSRGTGAKPFASPTGLAFDKRGDLWVADTGNGLIRKITPDGFVSTMAGGGTAPEDGFGPTLLLDKPTGVAITKDGSVWFSEPGRLRRLRSDSRVETVVGMQLVDPRGLHVDSKDRVIVADAGSHKVFRVTTDGDWETLAGSGERGYAGDDGPALKAMLDSPAFGFPEHDGSILICDTGNSRIRRLQVSTDPVITPPEELRPGVLRVLHADTGKAGMLAPGQSVFIEGDEPFPVEKVQLLFGAAAAEIVSLNPTRIVAIVPLTLKPGTLEVTLADVKGVLAVGQAEIAAAAPTLLGPIENEDGTPNTPEAPALRTAIVTLRITGAGVSQQPDVVAEVAGREVSVISVERASNRPGQLTIMLQLPGGFLPSGLAPLSVTVDNISVAGALNVSIR